MKEDKHEPARAQTRFLSSASAAMPIPMTQVRVPGRVAKPLIVLTPLLLAIGACLLFHDLIMPLVILGGIYYSLVFAYFLLWGGLD